MGLSPGTRLGAYEIVGLIGAGGMGEVYRATDTNLKRAVAIKVLPEAFASDPERLARFQREAEVLATLNHPNVATLHGLEKTDGISALVMELVEGPTLADRIEQGPIPLDEALEIAKQVGVALETAHQQGIIHRDLKPANIKVRPDGTVKVLDFGLARAITPESHVASATTLSNSPTITTPAAVTGVGVLLGTAAYMAPEQAMGKTTDKRSDIWAFGCVLYEMLTGKRAFRGEDVSDTLAAVLRTEPDWTLLPHDTPVPVALLVRRALAKDPRRRPGDVAAILFVLSEPELQTRSGTSRGRPSTTWMMAAGLAGAAVLLAGTTWWFVVPRAPLPMVTRLSVVLPIDHRFTNMGRQAIAISPDGTQLAYTANARLWIRAMSGGEPRPLFSETQTAITSPVVCENSADRLGGLAVIELEQAAEPLTAPDWARSE